MNVNLHTLVYPAVLLLAAIVRFGRLFTTWGLLFAIVFIALGWWLAATVLAVAAVAVNSFLLGDAYGRSGGPKPR